MRIALLALVLVAGCTIMEPQPDLKGHAAATLAIHTTGGGGVSPAPADETHARSSCPTSGWVTHGDGHRTRCPECRPEWTSAATTPDCDCDDCQCEPCLCEAEKPDLFAEYKKARVMAVAGQQVCIVFVREDNADDDAEYHKACEQMDPDPFRVVGDLHDFYEPFAKDIETWPFAVWIENRHGKLVQARKVEAPFDGKLAIKEVHASRQTPFGQAGPEHSALRDDELQPASFARRGFLRRVIGR